jgi:hypothetical protein
MRLGPSGTLISNTTRPCEVSRLGGSRTSSETTILLLRYPLRFTNSIQNVSAKYGYIIIAPDPPSGGRASTMEGYPRANRF